MRKHTKATAPGQPSNDVPFTAQEETDRDAEELAAANRPEPPVNPKSIDELDRRLKVLEAK